MPSSTASYLSTPTSYNLQELKQAGILKVKYPTGYKKWKAKFDYWYNVTKDVNQTLTIIYGPEGSVRNYKGSLYCNANLKMNSIGQKRNKSK